MLARVQAHLESIYALELGVSVSRFLIDEATARRLGGTMRSDEELLLHEAADGALELSLFFSRELLAESERLSAYEPSLVYESHLSVVASLIEGVSHFLYVLHTASLGRRTSLLELEAQAEIDKFVAVVLARWGALDGPSVVQLYERLFVRVAYLSSLSEQERWRYVEANRLAARYCEQLLPMIEGRRFETLLRELRATYRLGSAAKLRRLVSGA